MFCIDQPEMLHHCGRTSVLLNMRHKSLWSDISKYFWWWNIGRQNQHILLDFQKSTLCDHTLYHVRLHYELIFSSESHHLQPHMTCSVVMWRAASPMCVVNRLRMEEAGGMLWNLTDIYNLSNLPLLGIPAELPLLNNSQRRRSNMDTLVHLSPPSICNTFHCLFPSVLCPLSLCTVPWPCLSSLGSERRTMNWFFLAEKLFVCKAAQTDYSSELWDDGLTWNNPLSNTCAQRGV